MATSPSSIAARLTIVERQLAWWRLIAAGALVALALVGLTALRQPGGPVPLEATSVTLRNSQGGSVTLSLKPSGDLEARFGRALGASPALSGVAGIVLVNPDGHEVARLGEPRSQQLGK